MPNRHCPGIRGTVKLLAGLLLCLASTFLSAESAGAAGIDAPSVDTLGSTQAQGKNVLIRLRVGADEIVSVGAGGFVRQGGKRLPLRRSAATVAPGGRATVELQPKRRWQEQRILRALSRGRTLRARVTVRFKDLAGNVAKRTRRVLLT